MEKRLDKIQGLCYFFSSIDTSISIFKVLVTYCRTKTEILGGYSMKTLIGGAIAVLLGVVGLAVWFGEFVNLLLGCVPPVLLLGGGLALYLGFDELKDSWKSDEGVEAPADDDKAKIAELEKELSELKK